MRSPSAQPCQLRPCVDEAVGAFSGSHPHMVVRAVFDPRVPSTILCNPATLFELLTLLLGSIALPSQGQPLSLFVFETDDPHSCVLRFELHGVGKVILPSRAGELAAQLGGEAGTHVNGSHSSTAWFTVKSNMDQRPTEPSPVLAATLGSFSILVVEDNEMNQRVAEECLRHLGYRCQIAENGAAAVRMAAERAFDVILMDIHMPQMDGLTATRDIRSGPGGHFPYIAALTAFALPGDKARCLAAGMDDYLTKPCRIEDLSALLTKVAALRKKPA